MRFSEKLSNLRKANNFSQEQLAERVGVSRQAVSKWELGSSYPDMEKMLKMCKVFDCTLDELMDDGALGEVSEKKESKIDLKQYLDDFLKLITSIYNMFITMTFKEKIKFLFEQAFIVVVLILSSIIINVLMNVFISALFSWMPGRFYFYILRIVEIILGVVLFILGVIIFGHLFKIRYLDYYVTVVDPNVSEKTVESSIENEGNVIREKLVIRDPKHSSSKFFELLGKIFVFTFKVLTVIISLPVFFGFVLSVFGSIVSITHIGYSSLFIFIAMAGIGLSMCIYIIIEYLYKFVFNLEQQLKKIFYIGLAGLILLGVGSGLSFGKVLSMDKIDMQVKYLKTETIDFDEKLDIHKSSFRTEVNFSVDENVNDIKIKMSSVPTVEPSIIHEGDSITLINDGLDTIEIYKYIIEGLKENKFLFSEDYTLSSFEIISNEENIEILKKNYEKNYKD